MRDRKRNSHRALKALLTGALVALGAVAAVGQTASSTYHGTKADPFVKYKPPVKRAVIKRAPMPVPVPDIQARINAYKAQKLAAMNLQQVAPKPTTALLLSEVEVIGISRTPRGYAAMVEATPIHLSYVVYPGEQFYDGMLVAIEETRLVFRRQTRWTDGRVEVAVDTKPLRQPNAVTDSLTASKPASPDAASSTSSGKSEVTALVEALKALAASANSKSQEAPADSQGQQSGQNSQSTQDGGKP
jgi:hypothetical protein